MSDYNKSVNGRGELRVVRLLRTEMCLTCRFASQVVLERASGRTTRIYRCTRLDCDNWQFDPALDADKPVRLRPTTGWEDVSS